MLYNIIKQPLLPSTIQFHLKKTGIRAVVKSKCPLLDNQRWISDLVDQEKDWI